MALIKFYISDVSLYSLKKSKALDKRISNVDFEQYYVRKLSQTQPEINQDTQT